MLYQKQAIENKIMSDFPEYHIFPLRRKNKLHLMVEVVKMDSL